MAHDKKALIVHRIGRTEAAQAFQACAGLDPQGLETPESAAMVGECYAAAGELGRVAFSVVFSDGGAWVVAAAGGGREAMAADTLDAIEQLARKRGCTWVGFQTMRRGLHRIATRRGYHAKAQFRNGFILRKSL